MTALARRAAAGIVTSLAVGLLYFHEVLVRPGVLVHADYQYAITTEAHVAYHLASPSVHAAKLPFLAVLRLFDVVAGDYLAQDLFTVFVLALACLVVFLANDHFLRRIFDGLDGSRLVLAAALGTVVFAWNPWTVVRSHHHYWIVLSLACSYGVLAALDAMTFERFDRWHVLVLALLVLGAGTQPQSLLLYVLLPVAVAVGFWSVVRGERFLRRTFRPRLLLAGLVVLVLNLFWLYPFAMTVASGAASSLPAYGMVVENVDTLSSRSSFANVFSLSSRWIWGGSGTLSTTDYSLRLAGTDLWLLVRLLPAVLSIAPLLLSAGTDDRTERQYVGLFSVLFVAFVLFSTGSYTELFGDAYRWLFLEAPLGSAFRDPYKSVGFLAVLAGVLVPTTALYLGRYVPVRRNWVVVGLVVVPALFGWPALTGDVGGHLDPYQRTSPDELADVVGSVDGSEPYNVLWFPSGSFSYGAVPEISTARRTVALPGEYVRLLERAVTRGDRAAVRRLLDRLHVEYVVVRSDFAPATTDETRDASAAFESLFRADRAGGTGNFTVYEFGRDGSHLEAFSRGTVSYSGDRLHATRFEATVSRPYPGIDAAHVVSNGTVGDSPVAFTEVVPRSVHYDPDENWSAANYGAGWLSSVPYEAQNLTNSQGYFGEGVVFATDDASGATVETTFRVEEAGEYRLFGRQFESERGGRIRVSVDGESARIDTQSSIDRFRWREAGTYDLAPGTHTLTLANVDGFNVVNLFALVEADRYERQQRRLARDLRNDSVVSLFEAESDLHREGETAVRSDRNASGGELLRLAEGASVHRTVEAPTGGRYRLAVRGDGVVRVELDGRSPDVVRRTPAYSYLEPVELDRGTHALNVTATNGSASLDVVWLYKPPADAGAGAGTRTVQELLAPAAGSATVERYEAVGPATYRARVEASGPHVLSLAEAYDPLWEAAVRTGDGTERVEPTRLYGAVTGFRIEETGTYDVTIRYRPRGWFERGAFVSGVALLAFLGAMGYDRRRRRPDETR